MPNMLGTTDATVFLVVWTLLVFVFGFINGRSYEQDFVSHHSPLEEED